MKGAADHGKHTGRVGGREIGAVDHDSWQQIMAVDGATYHGSRSQDWSSRSRQSAADHGSRSRQQMEQHITTVCSRSRDRGWLLGVSFSRGLKRVHWGLCVRICSLRFVLCVRESVTLCCVCVSLFFCVFVIVTVCPCLTLSGVCVCNVCKRVKFFFLLMTRMGRVLQVRVKVDRVG